MKLWEQSIAIHKEKERIDVLRREIESKHREVTDSINYASRIQTALLPPENYLNEMLPDYFVLFRPRDVVSGDFYWAKQQGNNAYIVAADCTGHGVPGAFMSMLGISFLNEILASNKNLKVSDILEEMRNRVKESLRQSNDIHTPQDGMDMVICKIDFDSLKMDFAGANNGIMIIRGGENIEVKGVKNPVAIYVKERPFKTEQIELQKGDRVYMYSDGFVDQFGGKDGRKILKSNFVKLLKDIYQRNVDIKTTRNELNDFLENWMQDEYSQVDDILVIGVQV